MQEHSEHVEWATEVARLALSGASSDDVRSKAEQVKKEMTEAYWALVRSLSYVDQTVAMYAPDRQWKWGFVEMIPQATEGDPDAKELLPRTTEADRVLQVAKEMLREGSGTVNSREIAERLMSLGILKGLPKNITIKVSNILNNYEWKKVATSEYAPPEREGVNAG